MQDLRSVSKIRYGLDLKLNSNKIEVVVSRMTEE